MPFDKIAIVIIFLLTLILLQLVIKYRGKAIQLSFPKTTNINDTYYITEYEGIEITAIHGNENILGFQFHPEKSGKSGLKLLKSFLLS